MPDEALRRQVEYIGQARPGAPFVYGSGLATSDGIGSISLYSPTATVALRDRAPRELAPPISAEDVAAQGRRMFEAFVSVRSGLFARDRPGGPL